MIMEEIFNIKPEKKVRDRSKEVQYATDTPKVLKCCSDPRVNLGGGAATEGKKWRVISIKPPSQPGYLTASTATPRVAKEVGREPPRVKMAQGRALKQV